MRDLSRSHVQARGLPSLAALSPSPPPPAPRSNVLTPRPTTLGAHLECDDEDFLDFLAALLTLDPTKRPSAATALKHPWLQPEAHLPFEPYVLA